MQIKSGLNDNPMSRALGSGDCTNRDATAAITIQPVQPDYNPVEVGLGLTRVLTPNAVQASHNISRNQQVVDRILAEVMRIRRAKGLDVES